MQNCRVFRLNSNDLDRSVDDPALSLLFREGWSVICPIAVEEDSKITIALILSPPTKGVKEKIMVLNVVITVCIAVSLLYMCIYGVIS
jgi:hypothetical protein